MVNGQVYSSQHALIAMFEKWKKLLDKVGWENLSISKLCCDTGASCILTLSRTVCFVVRFFSVSCGWKKYS